MGTEHRTVMQVRLNTPPEARRALEGVRLELQDCLLARYGSRLGIDVGEVSDPGKELAEAVVGSAAEEAVLSLAFDLHRGSREGASLHLRWDGDEPSRLVVATTASSKLEGRLLEWFIGTPMVALAIYTFLFISWGWIPVALAALLGGVVGTGIYYALAAPVLALTAGRAKGTNAALARDLHALAVRCIRESPSVSCAPPLHIALARAPAGHSSREFVGAPRRPSSWTRLPSAFRSAPRENSSRSRSAVPRRPGRGGGLPAAIAAEGRAEETSRWDGDVLSERDGPGRTPT